RGDLGFHLAPQLLRHRVEHIRLDDLALQNRGDGNSGRRAQERDVLRLGLAPQRVERVLAAQAELFFDGTALQVVVVGGEGGGKRVRKAVDPLRHAVCKGLGRAGGELQRAKAARGVERADINPVARLFGRAGDALQLGTYGADVTGTLVADS